MEIRLIIAGGRDFTDYRQLEQEADAFVAEIVGIPGFDLLGPESVGFDLDITIISGAAKGADSLGEEWADSRLLKVESKPANWEKYGNAAGPIRNGEMAEIATHCLVFWDRKSRGSKDMVAKAKRKELGLKVVNYTSGEDAITSYGGARRFLGLKKIWMLYNSVQYRGDGPKIHWRWLREQPIYLLQRYAEKLERDCGWTVDHSQVPGFNTSGGVENLLDCYYNYISLKWTPGALILPGDYRAHIEPELRHYAEARF